MTAPPQHRVKHRVPHVRDGFIVANVGMGTFVEAPPIPLPPRPLKYETSKVEVD
jgi:hypothetical protein